MQGHKVDSTSSTSLLEGVNGSPIGDWNISYLFHVIIPTPCTFTCVALHIFRYLKLNKMIEDEWVELFYLFRCQNEWSKKWYNKY